MDLDKLKSNWQNQAVPNLSLEQMKDLVKTGKHPGLVRSRKVLIMESVAWSLFLLLFYDAFDGHQKPWWLNGLLGLAFLLLLAHHLMGIRLMGKSKANESLAISLTSYRSELQQFIRFNFSSRLLAMASLFLFFFYGVEWSGKRYLLSAGMLGLMVIQFYFLQRFWQGRISNLDQYWEEEV
ncbi:MAG: hypothetical protein HRU41_07260 [Saprospiraceae bacterium]|nr:hypothetical protein [Saprospiraceae bacterium]